MQSPKKVKVNTAKLNVIKHETKDTGSHMSTRTPVSKMQGGASSAVTTRLPDVKSKNSYSKGGNRGPDSVTDGPKGLYAQRQQNTKQDFFKLIQNESVAFG